MHLKEVSAQAPPEWVNQLFLHTPPVEAKEPREQVPIDDIIYGLKHAIEYNESQYTTEVIALKVKVLSERELEQYHSRKFGFILEFFSKICNWFKSGAFISSGQLGMNLAEEIIKRRAGIGRLSNAGKDVLSIDKNPISEKESIEAQSIMNLMLEDLLKIWTPKAPLRDKEAIRDLWALVLKDSIPVSWNEVNSGENGDKHYHLALKEELHGMHKLRVPGHVVLNKEMEVVFSENERGNVISFAKSGVVHRVKAAFWEIDVDLESIAVHNEEVEIRFQKFGRLMTKKFTIQAAKHFWQNVKWQTNP